MLPSILNFNLADTVLCRNRHQNTKGNMAKKKVSKDSYVFSTRLEYDQYHMLKTIAAIESSQTDETVSIQDLIRNAIKFVYEDNERLRECFRRVHGVQTRRRA